MNVGQRQVAADSQTKSINLSQWVYVFHEFHELPTVGFDPGISHTTLDNCELQYMIGSHMYVASIEVELHMFYACGYLQKHD